MIDFPEFCKFYLMLGRFGRSYPSLIYGIPWFSSPSFIAVVLVECRGMSWNEEKFGEEWRGLPTERYVQRHSQRFRRAVGSPHRQLTSGLLTMYLAISGITWRSILSIFVHINPYLSMMNEVMNEDPTPKSCNLYY